MDSYVKNITIDVNAEDNYTMVKAKQGDKINRKIAITLKKDGANFTPSGVSQIWFRMEKPDGNIAIVKSTDSGNPISVSGNTYTVTLTEQCLVVDGEAWCDLALLDASGNTLSSAAFVMKIIPMPNGNSATSTSAWTDLQKAIDDAERFANIVAFRTSGDYIQYTVDGQTWTNLVNVGAIGGDLQNQIGDLSDLTTTHKTSLVEAANELKGSLNAITPFDTTPTSGSAKGVTSGGVFTAITKDNLSQKIFDAPIVTDLNNCKYGSNGYNTSTANTPVANTYGVCYQYKSTSWIWQIAFDTNGNVYRRRNINSAGWTSWESPVYEKYTQVLSRYDDQDIYLLMRRYGNVVSINAADGVQRHFPTSWTQVATLPEDFRPNSPRYCPVMLLNNKSITYRIQASGSIEVIANDTSNVWFQGSGMYFIK